MPRRNPIESVLTALPVIMLVAGLWFYYSGESEQRNGELIRTETQEASGTYTGISAQGEKAQAQRIFWLQTSERLRGGRVTKVQATRLEAAGLVKGQQVNVFLAPRVTGSSTLWVYRVVRIGDGEVLLELAAK